MRMNPNDWPDEVAEGRRAFFAFQDEYDNPYDDVRREAWRYGWEQARDACYD